MASEPRDPRDGRSDFDYQGGGTEVPPALEPLEGLVRGDVRFDAYTKELFATDASIYEVTPLGVVFPTDAEDVERAVEHCWEQDIPVLPRGAGTSLAGQAVNAAVVLDFTRYMDEVQAIDADSQRCRAQPGIVLADLNEAMQETGLKFPPDPAWGDKSTLGGAIGNNSTGAHSLLYGKTDAYIETCDVVLADGTRTTFGECTVSDLQERGDPAGTLEERIYACLDRLIVEESATVLDAFPDIERNVSGYNLDRLMTEAETGSVNVARLLAGSEGTLAIVTSATVRLEPMPETTGVALLVYEELVEAMRDVEVVLDHEPAAVEIVDDVLLDLARETEEFGDIAGALPEATEAVLLVEFYASDEEAARQQVANLIADRAPAVTTIATPDQPAGGDAPRRASGAFEAEDRAERHQFWKLRKSGLPILLSRTTDDKHVAFIEDTAVPPSALADYVSDVQEVLAAHDTFASFYAHAGPGCLHIRPLVNTRNVEGVETMESIADAVTDLVLEYGGSISGEHGDGRARTQWVEKQYGEDVTSLFRELKTAFDPKGLLNPGQVCGEIDMTENLRLGPETASSIPFEPELAWENENGFRGMAELCHGCGGCRGGQTTTGGVMCPTYRASQEEITSTRGRANLLRQAMTGDLPPDAMDDATFFAEVMDLCIGCKGCARDCPSEVDMAKLKVEVTHAHHQTTGIDRRTNLFANIHRVGAIGSTLAPVSNWVARLPGSGLLAEKTLGIARERTLPSFHRETFLDWAEKREQRTTPAEAQDEVLLLPDVMTTYHDPAIAKAAVQVLEAADISVSIPNTLRPTGRAAYSLGCLDVARTRAEAMLEALDPVLDQEMPVLTLEPSDASMLQSDYDHLLADPAVDRLAEQTYGVMEYLDREEITLPTRGSARLTYHGHCHEKASKRADHATHVLERHGWEVDQLDSGCCGMAGAFGYEAEHYAMSKAIGDILFEQVAGSDGDRVLASGASCRSQLKSYPIQAIEHPVETLAKGLYEAGSGRL